MKKGFLLCVLLAVVVSNVWAGPRLTVCTEEFPPFNYLTEGKPDGLSTEVMTAVLKEAGLDYDIRFYPWARSYRLTLKNQNYALYSTSRRPSREELFKWVGIVAPSEYAVFALKKRTDIKINRLEDLKNYRMGTSRDDAREAFFIEQGFKRREHLYSATGADPNSSNLRILMAGRIDLLPLPIALCHYLLKKNGYDPASVKQVYYLDELSKGGYYLAVNKDTDDRIVEALQRALDTVKANGTYDRIMKKWGL